MVRLPSKSVLNEYLTSRSDQHSVGKLRVRGVQIHALLGKVLNRGEMNCNMELKTRVNWRWGFFFGVNPQGKLGNGANKIFFYFWKQLIDLEQAHRDEHFKPIKG